MDTKRFSIIGFLITNIAHDYMNYYYGRELWDKLIHVLSILAKPFAGHSSRASAARLVGRRLSYRGQDFFHHTNYHR